MEKKVLIQGVFVDTVSFDEALLIANNSIRENKNCHIVTINPEIIQSSKKDFTLKNIINNANLVVPDGIGIILALKFKGIKQEQITGVEFSRRMLEVCAKNNFKVALIGAKPDVVETAKENIIKKYENIQITYAKDGYFDDFEPVIEDVIKSDAKFIMCAMGSPKQEYFISEMNKKVKGAVMIGVGGTFDVFANKVNEAPLIYKKMGLEWLYRTAKEPKRLKRIFPALPIFFFQSIIEGIKNKLQKGTF